jgi:hypothetical protein
VCAGVEVEDTLGVDADLAGNDDARAGCGHCLGPAVNDCVSSGCVADS